MKRRVYNISKINYIFDASRIGNKYSFDNGAKWINTGEAVEVLIKSVLGLLGVKDANTGFNKGSDIKEYKASVKSPRFTLTSVALGNTFEEVKERYFKEVASEMTIFGIIAGEDLITYWMTMEEFKEYLEVFGTWEPKRKVIRGKQLSNQMITWFERKVDE